MFDMWQRQRRNANKRDPLKDRQYYAWYRRAGTVWYLRFNEAVCFFTRRVSSGLKICSLALPLRCLCVIITTCSPLFLLSYIYIPFFLSFFLFLFLFLRSRLCQIEAFAFFFLLFFFGAGCQLRQSGVDWGKQKCSRDLKGHLGGKVP